MRWLIDAMNVIGTRPDGWWKDRHAAMRHLVDQLERWAATTGEEVTVVFERRPYPRISSDSIEIGHAPRGRPNAADDEIVRRLRRDPHPEEVRVVTSDHALAERTRKLNATVEPAGSFRRELDEMQRERRDSNPRPPA